MLRVGTPITSNYLRGVVSPKQVGGGGVKTVHTDVQLKHGLFHAFQAAVQKLDNKKRCV